MTAIPLLAPGPVALPDPNSALDEPDGLLAAGGSLSVEWLLAAYAKGVFPWFNSDDEHILWWSPAKRAILRPGHMKVSRSLSKRIRNGGFTLTMDQAFEAVIRNCSKPRKEQSGTWITGRMRQAYCNLHKAGFAHSVEVWRQHELVGGLYGVSLGNVFCGESMFSLERDSSKVAFHALQQKLQAWRFSLIDCQIINPHLLTLGVIEVSRAEFLRHLAEALSAPTCPGPWSFDTPSASV